MTEWTCHEHGTVQADDKTYCPTCMDAFKKRLPVTELSIDERVAQLQRLMGQLTIPFPDVHEWITELMGRDVWTHEIAYPEQLIEELRSGDEIGIGDVIAKLPWDKPVIVTDGENATVLP